MDLRADVREFLQTRRARLTPDDVGLPAAGGGARRVSGLRREEVALLAGVSVDYYIRLERGNLAGASDSVLESLSRALRLDDAEHAHLFDLARAQNASPTARPRTTSRTLRPNVQLMLDSIMFPAWVRNGRSDYIGGNALGRALYSPAFDFMPEAMNTARFTFLDAAATEFFPDWSQVAEDSVAVLRAEMGRSPEDRELAGLVAELIEASAEFRARWAEHNVLIHRSGAKRMNHPEVGELSMTYEAMELVGDTGLTLVVYGAEPGSPTAERLGLLASLAATPAADAR